MNVPPTPFSRKDWEKPDSVQQPYTPGNRIRLDGHLSIKGRLEKTVINLASDDTIENDLSRLSEIIDRPFIFVSHSPPFQTPLDILYNNLHVGSSGIRNFIAKWSAKNRLIVSLHGHIHESPHQSGSISTTIQDTLCINPGQNSGSGVNLRYVVFKISETSGKPSIDILKSM
jgi:Icc-related predicted phosphoesterase